MYYYSYYASMNSNISLEVGLEVLVLSFKTVVLKQILLNNISLTNA